jgi:hypothetical protein
MECNEEPAIILSTFVISVGEKEEDIYEDLCHFNSRSKQLQNAIHSLQPVEKRDYILKVSFDSPVFLCFIVSFAAFRDRGDWYGFERKTAE